MGLFRFIRSLREGLSSGGWADTPRTPRLHSDEVQRDRKKRDEVKIQTVPTPTRPPVQPPAPSPASDPNVVDVEPIDVNELPQPTLHVDAQEAPLESGLIADDLKGLDETLGDTPPQPVEPEPDHEPEPEFAFQEMQTDEGAAQMARQFYARRGPKADDQ